uniref:Uncharacterized protein n=1 Tax=Meloidogyne hapla TaxID=6305 RepID=A0A1I8BMU7_MELHA
VEGIENNTKQINKNETTNKISEKNKEKEFKNIEEIVKIY